MCGRFIALLSLFRAVFFTALKAPQDQGLGLFSIKLYPLCLAPVSSEHLCYTNEWMDDPSANKAVMLLPRTRGGPCPQQDGTEEADWWDGMRQVPLVSWIPERVGM